MLLNEFLKEHRKVEELGAKLAKQEKDFTARLKEQDAKIQQVNDKVELSKPAPQTVLNYYHTATLLQNGMVLVAGGIDSNFIPSASAEAYNPTGGTWIATDSLNNARELHTATLLQNGMVLVAGGLNTIGRPVARAELGRGPPKIHWDGSRKRPSRSLNQLCPSRK